MLRSYSVIFVFHNEIMLDTEVILLCITSTNRSKCIKREKMY